MADNEPSRRRPYVGDFPTRPLPSIRDALEAYDRATAELYDADKTEQADDSGDADA